MFSKFISHRGNTNGPIPELENKPDYILAALKKHPNISVEIDLWKIGDILYLGHDRPQYFIGEMFDANTFLSDKRLFIHAKNPAAIEYLIPRDVHWFCHQTDDYCLTSRGYLITFPGKDPMPRSILMGAEKFSRESTLGNYYLCSDYIAKYL